MSNNHYLFDSLRGDDYDRLVGEMVAFTRQRIDAACAEHGLTWLGGNGPVYDVWDGNLARAVYRDRDGCDYVDVDLFAETLGGKRETWAWIGQWLSDGDVPYIEHLVVTPSRGFTTTACVPVAVLAEAFHTEPTRLPATLWARTWWSDPIISDASEVAVIAAEQDPRCAGASALASRVPAELS